MKENTMTKNDILKGEAQASVLSSSEKMTGVLPQPLSPNEKKETKSVTTPSAPAHSENEASEPSNPDHPEQEEETKLSPPQNPVRFEEQVLQIDQRIAFLKKRKETMHLRQAALFVKEAEAIFGEEFSLDMALALLQKSWSTALPAEKQELKKLRYSFRTQTTRPRAQTPIATHHAQ